MIERQIVAQKFNRHQIEEFIFSFLGRLSCSHLDLQRTPLGERVIVYTAKQGLIVGRKGANIKLLTDLLKQKFNMENPQIEVAEINNPELDAVTVAKNLVGTFERFGPKRFKAIAYRALENLMKAGAKGAEIVVSGRGVPGVRAKSWRFKAGYLKKSGDVAVSQVDKAIEACNLRSGTIGIKVSILRPETILPDSIKEKFESKPISQGIKVEASKETGEIKKIIEEVKEEKKEKKTKKKTKEKDGPDKEELI